MNNLAKEKMLNDILNLNIVKPTEQWWNDFAGEITLEQKGNLAKGIGYLQGASVTVGYKQGHKKGYQKGLIIGSLCTAAAIVISEVVIRKIINKRRKTNE